MLLDRGPELFHWPGFPSYRPLFGKGLICKLLKIKWSGRVDSNHRPPGPEPWEGRFCRLLYVYANDPYRGVFFTFSMTSRALALHWLAAVCRLSLHEKGKKRAMSLFLVPLDMEFWAALVGAILGLLISVVQTRFKRKSA